MLFSSLADSRLSACDACLESAFVSIDNKLLTSINCGHRVCRRCLKHSQGDDAASVANASAAGTDSSASLPGPSQKAARVTALTVGSKGLRCPICQAIAGASEWVDRGTEDSIVEQEKIIRQRVLSIYNSTRENFESTPTYNDYLEKREDTIYELVYGGDDNKKKALQEEFHMVDVQNQKQVIIES